VKAVAEIKVLIVEDDPFFQRVLQKRLAAEGYQVHAASDGREGMKAIVAFEPDLVISDWMMPEVDGLELCQSVKTGLRETAPYFILLTAKGEISNRLLGLETGADDYLVKPCDQGELMARVRAGLRIVLLTQDLRHTLAELHQSNAELQAARAETSRLAQELLPICSFCKKVRDADGEWMNLEDYLSERAQLDVTHGICPGCRIANYPSVRPDGLKSA
jgi:sigma-B regulation protein RsbU (phosphoserine phosphatase)